MPNSKTQVYLIKTSDRSAGVKALLRNFDLKDYAGKPVALKVNFNSADPFPASTHLETLQAIVEALKKADAADITLGERSGMGETRKVLEEMDVFALSKQLGFQAVVLNELPKEGWVKVARDGLHWLKGFYLAKQFAESEKVVQTCCLKAHRFGGHFTLSLKNSVGLVAKKVPGSIYDYMWELHGSPYQRQMIAEINRYYHVDLVVMDGIKAFVDGGPEQGRMVEPELMLASRDRVAIDAVGIAILRSYGSTNHIMNGKIFELEQIRRAAELGVGVSSASDIQLTPLNPETREASEKLAGILEREG